MKAIGKHKKEGLKQKAEDKRTFDVFYVFKKRTPPGDQPYNPDAEL
jgi:hypothetical protein